MNEQKNYKLTLSGEGLNLEKPISEDLAHKILLLLTPSSSGSTKLVQIENGESATIGEQSIKEFLLEKKPITDIERITCLAYYLRHFRNTNEFKTKDLTDL